MSLDRGSKRLVRVCQLLNDAGVRYIVMGGFALALHGVIRATKDVDILIEPTIDNAARALNALAQGLPYGIAREITAREVVGKPITVVGDDPRVDLLTLAWSVRYADAAPHVRTVTIDGTTVPYADLETLIKSKRTDRLQDQADIEELERIRMLQGLGADRSADSD